MVCEYLSIVDENILIETDTKTFNVTDAKNFNNKDQSFIFDVPGL